MVSILKAKVGLLIVVFTLIPKIGLMSEVTSQTEDVSAAIVSNEFMDIVNLLKDTERNNLAAEKKENNNSKSRENMLAAMWLSDPKSALKNIALLQAADAVGTVFSAIDGDSKENRLNIPIENNNFEQVIDSTATESKLGNLDLSMKRVWLTQEDEYTTAKNVAQVIVEYDPPFPIKNEPIYARISLGKRMEENVSYDNIASGWQVATVNVDGVNRQLDQMFVLEKAAPDGTFKTRHKYAVAFSNKNTGKVEVIAGYIGFAAQNYSAFGANKTVNSDTYDNVNSISSVLSNKDVIVANQASKTYNSQVSIKGKVKTITHEDGKAYITLTDNGEDIICSFDASLLPSFVEEGTDLLVAGKLINDSKRGYILSAATITKPGTLDKDSDSKNMKLGDMIGKAKADAQNKLNGLRGQGGGNPVASGGGGKFGVNQNPNRVSDSPVDISKELNTEVLNHNKMIAISSSSLLTALSVMLGTLIGIAGLALGLPSLAIGGGVIATGLVIVGLAGGAYMLYDLIFNSGDMWQALAYTFSSETGINDLLNVMNKDAGEHWLEYTGTAITTALFSFIGIKANRKFFAEIAGKVTEKVLNNSTGAKMWNAFDGIIQKFGLKTFNGFLRKSDEAIALGSQTKKGFERAFKETMDGDISNKFKNIINDYSEISGQFLNAQKKNVKETFQTTADNAAKGKLRLDDAMEIRHQIEQYLTRNKKEFENVLNELTQQNIARKGLIDEKIVSQINTDAISMYNEYLDKKSLDHAFKTIWNRYGDDLLSNKLDLQTIRDSKFKNMEKYLDENVLDFLEKEQKVLGQHLAEKGKFISSERILSEEKKIINQILSERGEIFSSNGITNEEKKLVEQHVEYMKNYNKYLALDTMKEAIKVFNSSAVEIVNPEQFIKKSYEVKTYLANNSIKFDTAKKSLSSYLNPRVLPEGSELRNALKSEIIHAEKISQETIELVNNFNHVQENLLQKIQFHNSYLNNLDAAQALNIATDTYGQSTFADKVVSEVYNKTQTAFYTGAAGEVANEYNISQINQEYPNTYVPESKSFNSTQVSSTDLQGKGMLKNLDQKHFDMMKENMSKMSNGMNVDQIMTKK